MTEDDLIKMAKEAGVKPLLYDGKWAVEGLDAFAALVAAQTREECAKAVQGMALANPGMMYMTADQCASIILKEKNA